MTSRILNKMRSWMGRQTSREAAPYEGAAPAAPRVEFLLTYGPLTIGTLSYELGFWEWNYSDAFRAQDKIVPLIEFPDTNRPYRTNELWPFFATRAPSLKRTDILPILEAEHIDPNDEVALLKRFGRRTITNPFELIAA